MSTCFFVWLAIVVTAGWIVNLGTLSFLVTDFIKKDSQIYQFLRFSTVIPWLTAIIYIVICLAIIVFAIAVCFIMAIAYFTKAIRGIIARKREAGS